MENQENRPGWRIWGVTVQGASHQRIGKENQDAIDWIDPAKDESFGYALAVADGHGSPRSSRSQIGSQLAVEVLLELAHDYIREAEPTANTFSFVKQAVEQKLPQDLIRLWRERVDKRKPADDQRQQERQAKVENLPEAVLGVEESNSKQTNYVLYGSTILGVLLTSYYVVYLQLGDGDILIVSENGEVSRPFTRDERLLANQTTSLATTLPSLNTLERSSSYASDVYVKFELFQNDPPALILVSTDGYSNSYKDDRAFEQIGPDYLELLKTEGLSVIEDNLEGWLNETSQTGSGDDITLGLIVRADILPNREKVSSVTAANVVEPEVALILTQSIAEETLSQTNLEEVTE